MAEPTEALQSAEEFLLSDEQVSLNTDSSQDEACSDDELSEASTMDSLAEQLDGIDIDSRHTISSAADDLLSIDSTQLSVTEADVDETHAEIEKSAGFAKLPLHFMVKLCSTMTYKELAGFRLTCKLAYWAVDHYGTSLRAFDVKRLIGELWPEKKRVMRFDSLFDLRKEMTQLASFLKFSLITSVSFEGIGTLCADDLETYFGTAPLPKVHTLSLTGCIIMPSVFEALSNLFPGVVYVSCTEDIINFPDNVIHAVATRASPRLAPNTVVDQRRLERDGQLDYERVATLRSLKMLFPSARSMYID